MQRSSSAQIEINDTGLCEHLQQTPHVLNVGSLLVDLTMTTPDERNFRIECPRIRPVGIVPRNRDRGGEGVSHQAEKHISKTTL